LYAIRTVWKRRGKDIAVKLGRKYSGRAARKYILKAHSEVGFLKTWEVARKRRAQYDIPAPMRPSL
jgi:hypothetical protein